MSTTSRSENRRLRQVVQNYRQQNTDKATQNLKSAMMTDRISLIISIVAFCTALVAISRTMDSAAQ